jgi:hypothetical protein
MRSKPALLRARCRATPFWWCGACRLTFELADVGAAPQAPACGPGDHVRRPIRQGSSASHPAARRRTPPSGQRLLAVVHRCRACSIHHPAGAHRIDAPLLLLTSSGSPATRSACHGPPSTRDCLRQPAVRPDVRPVGRGARSHESLQGADDGASNNEEDRSRHSHRIFGLRT